MSKIDLAAELKEHSLTRAALAEKSCVPLRTVYAAVKGTSIDKDSADKIALALGMKPEKVFTFQENERTLSPKTILEHHRLISTVLDQAEKEGLVPFNVAAKASAFFLALFSVHVGETSKVAVHGLSCFPSEPRPR